jgi:hypothetical protein
MGEPVLATERVHDRGSLLEMTQRREQELAGYRSPTRCALIVRPSSWTLSSTSSSEGSAP